MVGGAIGTNMTCYSTLWKKACWWAEVGAAGEEEAGKLPPNNKCADAAHSSKGARREGL